MRVPREFLIRFIAHSVAIIKKQLERQHLLELNKDLTLIFVTGRKMKQLNHQFRKKNHPTDVLSFAPIEASVLGELVLCPEVLVRQAREQGHSLRIETAYMCLHGILHLLGFDHETGPRDAQMMFAIQDKTFAKAIQRLGIRGRNKKS